MKTILTDKCLLVMNLEPNRWPAGAPENGNNALIPEFDDCDSEPTKTEVMRLKNDETLKHFYELSFSKREAVELYDWYSSDLFRENLANK